MAEIVNKEDGWGTIDEEIRRLYFSDQITLYEAYKMKMYAQGQEPEADPDEETRNHFYKEVLEPGG